MKKIIAFVLVLLLAFSPCMMSSALFENKAKIRLVVPENWELEIGDSRSVECTFSSSIKNRMLTWTASPKSVATVDEWGRVTAVSEGKATITATTHEGYTSSVELNVVRESTKSADAGKIKSHNYAGKAIAENEVLQKVVTRFAASDAANVPANVKDANGYAAAQKVKTSDGATWEITNYGVLRTDKNAANKRDAEMRFMGDRYFYSPDTGDGKVLAIFDDGANGIWTAMAEGYTHIAMTVMNGTEKAAIMSKETQDNVARRGMVSNAYLQGNGTWKPVESDNDGLWTSMYGAGELMRYAVLRDDPNATPKEIEAARQTAYSATEAVLLLTYISMRTGTVESYVRAQRSGTVADLNPGKWFGEEALVKGGDYSQNIPEESPAAAFQKMYNQYVLTGIRSFMLKQEDNIKVMSPSSWTVPSQNPDTDYAKRTRLLEGFWARTYSLAEEHNRPDGYIHWKHNGDGTATGVSEKPQTSDGYLLNGENLRGLTVDASGEIPERLWNDLLGSNVKLSDITYKGDTSADEIIGHVFLYKLAYDILGEEDEEIKELIVNTVDKFAQHITDNGYALCDGSGQPTTWSKFNRPYFDNGQNLGSGSLSSAVCLSVLKLAAYVTGDQKWEDEYRMAALDPAFEYAKVMTQHWERYQMAILAMANSVTPILGFILRPLMNTKLFRLVYRLALNYSDEEMAMLAYYVLFQLEDDEELLGYYRDGLEDWWYSISHSENPLWYYIYQLAYPEKAQKDVYGNNLLEIASWSLSRHPLDLRKYLASNPNRDDVALIDFAVAGVDGTAVISYDPNYKRPWFYDNDNGIIQIVGVVLSGANLKWKVPAPDERELHKFNGSTYRLGEGTENWAMEGSTTYTLPYWMGRYHGMLEAK